MISSRARLAAALALSTIALARHPVIPGCGTHSSKADEELFLHRQAERRTGQSRIKRLAAARNSNRDYGNIAVLDASEGLVARRNPFNLDLKTISFVPSDAKAARYKLESSGYTFIRDAGGTPLASIGDDDTVEVALPFAVPFFGQIYTSIWINSNGNLTFGAGDGNTTSQTFGRLVGGSPRIAGLFEDLDPTAARSGAIRVLSQSSRFVITFDRIPEYSDFNFGQEQTFQYRIYSSGRIEIAYSGITALDAVVGISPGGLRGTPALVTLSLTNDGEFTGAVGEVFAGAASIDIPSAAQKFYATHEDSYDYLVFFNALGIQAATNAVAWESTVRNRRSGYGDSIRSDGGEYGSRARLQAVMNMGPIEQYPVNPGAPVPLRGPTGDTPLTILGHEAGHLFLAFASVEDPNTPGSTPMLGRAGVHWAFTFNSDASFMEGNRIRDNGAGSSPRFTTTKAVESYSSLDRYLMGFVPEGDVQPTYYVANASVSPTRAPQPDVGFDGVRREVTVQDVITAVGRRTPDSTVAQRRFRFGFVLMVPTGADPTPQQVAQVEAYRAAFDAFWGSATGNNALADSSLKRALHLSTWPAAGVLVNRTASATITVESAVKTPLTIFLDRQSGLVEAPAAVTINPGESKVSFTVRGLRAGVEDLTARAADSAFEGVSSRIQVQPSAEALKLTLAAGSNTFRVTDQNALPYGGVTIIAGNQSVVTNENGEATFAFEPGTTATVAIEGAPSSAIVISVPGLPVIAAGTNAASYLPGITSNSFATIFGANLGAATQVLVNGEYAPIAFVSASQINFRVPAVAGPVATLTVVSGYLKSAEFRVPIRPVSPGIFAIVRRGTALEIYATGLNGASPQVTVGGLPAQVVYTGQPQFPGLDQINVDVPPGLPPEPQLVVISAGGVISNAFRINAGT
jgi:hypothetical protein